MSALIDRIGGEALERVLRDFYDRVFADPMIGHMFEGKNKERLIRKEWELVAGLLGAGVRYTGRPMREAHARVLVFGGHFDRRMQILEETLADHAVDPEVRRRWLDHAASLRAQLVSDPDQACNPGPDGNDL
ncbi:MAG TPA: group 1 truncated hemoglobin [Kofleriaceae bacterium]|nr:group 1 truncated hemoglobin [Kofleriaceae bacterium]